MIKPPFSYLKMFKTQMTFNIRQIEIVCINNCAINDVYCISLYVLRHNIDNLYG